jgi:oxaloacetate decarboxylase alpha subunit
MDEIKFVDTTLRDAHQSLWAMRMRTDMMYPIAKTIDRIGFKAVDFGSGSHFGAIIRFLRENPWERVRLMSKAMPNTPLTWMMLSKSVTQFTPFDMEPDLDLLALWIKRIGVNGIRRIMIMEQSNIISDMAQAVQLIKKEGLEVVVALSYSHSPVHTDKYYAQKAREVAEQLRPDIIYLKDPAGLLTPERTKTLVPVIMKNIDNIPLEIHSHCTTGLAPLCYLEAIRLGVRTVHTAISPLANGSSQPSTENTLNNVRSLGFSARLDEGALKEMADHFRYVAENENLPMGAPVEYDLSQYEHQVPGGVISNLRSQLAGFKMEHRLQEVIDEVGKIRRELGYPIMITPFSQYIVTQATLNVTVGERYKSVTDDIIKLAMGFFGEQAAPMDQNVKDKILSSPKAKEFKERPRYDLKRLRQEIGSGLSDDEFLLRTLVTEEQIKAMEAAGPIKTEYPAKKKPVMALIQQLMKSNMHYIRIKEPDFSIVLSKS